MYWNSQRFVPQGPMVTSETHPHLLGLVGQSKLQGNGVK